MPSFASKKLWYAVAQALASAYPHADRHFTPKKTDFLYHEKVGKRLEEHFFICSLRGYDLAHRSGPEFDDPTRGQYIPEEIRLDEASLNAIDFRTPELRAWLLANLAHLQVA